MVDGRVRAVVGVGGIPLGAAGLLWTQALRARARAGVTPPAYRVSGEVPAGAAGQPVRMAVIGDSAVAGVGAATVEGSLAIQVAVRVAAAVGRPVYVDGFGVSGARTADVRAQQVPRLAAARHDVVVTVVGTNDVVRLTPPPVVARETDALLRDLAAVAGAPVVFCSLPEIRCIPVLGVPLREVAAAYAAAVTRAQLVALRRHPQATYVDARRLCGPLFARRPDMISADGFHPSPAGYGLIADALAPAVVRALSGQLEPDDLAPPARHRAPRIRQRLHQSQASARRGLLAEAARDHSRG